MRLPNILYLHSHDTGRYIQPYGHAIPTPNIQRLAEQGVLFRQAFTAAPTCSPSRAALLAGMSPHSCGQYGLAHRGFLLRDTSQHIVHTLKNVGYTSALIGIQHIRRDAATIGYDHIVETDSRSADDVADAAAGYFRGKLQEPFFASIGTFETHRVFPEVPTDVEDRYTLPPAPLPDESETRRDMAAFKAGARQLDTGFGRVLDVLDESGLADNTLVICTTDHGIAFPRMKCNLTDHGAGVMLIMRGPGGFSGGRVCDALVSQIDLFPTICDLLEIDAPPWLEGRSIMPLIRGEVDEVNEEIFAEVNYHTAYEPMRAVRTGRWKYIRRFHDRDIPFLSNCDAGPSKEVMLERGWADRKIDQEELFDLTFDPNESANLADQPGYGKILEEMRSRLDTWMKRTNDPLLKGEVPAPSGAVISRPDDVDPQDVWNYTARPKG